jgi:Domain of unknown function (DUF4413)
VFLRENAVYGISGKRNKSLSGQSWWITYRGIRRLMLIFFLYSFFYLIFFLYSFSQKFYREMKNIESLDSSLSPIVEAMKENFFKYWEEVPTVTIIANYLHPSFKKKYTVSLLQRYK